MTVDPSAVPSPMADYHLGIDMEAEATAADHTVDVTPAPATEAQGEDAAEAQGVDAAEAEAEAKPKHKSVTILPPPSTGAPHARPPSSGLRRMNTFNAATEEEQRNIISLRFRDDSIGESIEAEENADAETRVWRLLERVFCFLKGLTIYETRRTLRFIIVSQTAVNTIRIFPIILGLSYQATLPVLILYITLILGFHGTKYLVPRILFFYKIGMSLSLLVDVTWYILGYNGNLEKSVSQGTSVLMQAFLSIVLFLLNFVGLLYGWKLRRLVKSVESQRECDRAAIATMVPQTPPPRAGSMSISQLRQTLSVNPMVDDEERASTRRNIVIDVTAADTTSPRCKTVANERSSSSSSASSAGLRTPTAKFPTNEIRTSKYTFYNFPYVFFKMQFSRLANVYTTVVVMLCFFDFSPVSPVASLTPLLIVFATSALKDVSEDVRRQKSDFKVNSKPAHIVRRDTRNEIKHVDGMWQDIRVGDLLMLKDGDEVPADCILLATSRPDGHCYVETSNLDGETSLKIRSVASSTKHFLTADDILKKHRIEVECDRPNKDLFYFDGVLKLSLHQDENGAEGNQGSIQETSVSMDNLILRGSESRSAEWTIGLVIYTGHQTKISMNASSMPLKRSFVEKTLDTMFLLVLMMLFGIAIACTLGNNDWVFQENLLDDDTVDSTPWYLSEKNNGYIFLSYVILFNNLIPLSMYVTMEGVRFVHARYIENDLEMYDESTDTPAQVRNSNINEDLGQIQYIFSDKTGTLTRNEMVFSKCTIGGLRYNDIDSDMDIPQRPGTRFNDGRLLQRLNSNHSTKNDIHHFLLLLAICNTVIPDHDSAADGSTSGIRYNASSPDEEALVFAAKDLGYELVSRDGPMCHTLIQGQPTQFEILNVLEFNSDRKRMSVIARHPDGTIILYCKGADDVIFDLLSKSQPQGVAHVTRGHLQEYASDGLRTLTTAMRVLSTEEYEQWNQLYRKAELAMEGRAHKIAKVSAVIEVEMTLLGATAIEDLLQDGVEECICSLRKAGINFWVLTGDKKETAISIGMSSHVIDDNMDVIVLGQRDKTTLRAKLEELYLDLVDDKWGSDENSSATRVLYEAFKRGLAFGWSILKAAAVGRDQPEGAHRRRRRAPRVNDLDGTDMPPRSNVTFSHGGEVYPTLQQGDSYSEMNIDPGHGDKTFEPKGDPMTFDDEYFDEDLEYAMVIDGKTLSLVLEDDIKYLFLAVATQCKSVICCRCSPSQKAAVVTLVTEPTLMFSPGNITLAIGDGANDVPMIQAANVGIGISGKEGRQAVLSSDYALAQFRFLKRLLLVHGNYSYKRISKLILFSFMKNVALSMSNFFLAVQAMYSGLLMYFGIFFTLYNALFTTIPIVFIAMHNQDVSPAVLMQYPMLYVNGLKNRSFNWLTFLGWCGLGIWHAFVIFSVPFFTNGYFVYTFTGTLSAVVSIGNDDVGLWGVGTAAYTYLIVASTVQVSLMTSNWTNANKIWTIGTLIFYFAFLAFFSNLFGWTHTDLYETEIAYGVFNKLVGKPWFWLGLLFSTVAAVIPNYFTKAGRILFYPEPSHLMREWNSLAKSEEMPTTAGSPRLVRRHTGFAFSQYPGEREMVLGHAQNAVSTASTTSSAGADQRSHSPASTPEEWEKTTVTTLNDMESIEAARR